MKILILSTFFPPLNSIASLRPYSWAKYWTLEGHQVTVITLQRKGDLSLELPHNGYKVHAIKQPAILDRFKPKQVIGLPVDKVKRKGKPSWISVLREKTGVFSAIRMPDLTDFWIKPATNYAKSLNEKWDVVISTFGPYAPHAVAHHLKKKGLAKKWVADFRDLWVDHHFYKGLWPFKHIEKYLEKKYMLAADLVTVVSPGMQRIYAKKYPQIDIEVIENGVDPEDWLRLNPKKIFPEDQQIRIVYTGTLHAGKRDPTPLLMALNELSQESAWSEKINRLEVLFAGHFLGNLDVLIEKYKVGKWVKNLGNKTHQESLRLQRDADILLFLEWNHPSAHYMLTGKLFEYLYSGHPLLAIGVAEASDPGRLILSKKAGRLCHNVQDIKLYLNEVLQNPPPKKSKELLPLYERQYLAKKLLQVINHSK